MGWNNGEKNNFEQLQFIGAPSKSNIGGNTRNGFDLFSFRSALQLFIILFIYNVYYL